jgi:hypothetical protein
MMATGLLVSRETLAWDYSILLRHFFRTDSTEPARSTSTTWDEMAEAFIREREFSRVIFKLNKAEKEAQEDVIASYSTDLDDFLELALVCFVITMFSLP